MTVTVHPDDTPLADPLTMTKAIVTLSAEGALLARRLSELFPDTDLYVHEGVPGDWNANRFAQIVELTSSIFSRYSALIYIAPCGVVVRSIANCIEHKTSDPAVVVLDVKGRWAVSLLSGHEGGANDLAVQVGNAVFAEPIITTTTEALKDLIVGVGCRRGASREHIVSAIMSALAEADLDLSRVRYLSSAQVKADEEGLLLAARDLNVPLRFISLEEIRNCGLVFQHSAFVEEKVNVPAVAEPSALLAGRRTKLLVPKKIYQGVTIAVARESCSW
jgi:cobalt-precorrin 5A hydrolase